MREMYVCSQFFLQFSLQRLLSVFISHLRTFLLIISILFMIVVHPIQFQEV